MVASRPLFLTDTNFLQLADRYFPLYSEDGQQERYEAFFAHKLKNLEKNEFLIPVLGVQGAGKSSFLNALLMDDLILPVDADETTCIPVEIRYSKEKNGQTEVYFAEEARKKTLTLTTANEIEQYVHNAYNYGNEKNVSHLVVYKDRDILKNGVVFVDLPGVKSLTPQNMQTTMRYIEKLSGAIFLLRTVPPITQSERVFLSTVWPKLTKAWFVQNQWNDESTKEVHEGLEHNKSVLQDISSHHNTNEQIDIRIVNVYKALVGRLEENNETLTSAGLTQFSDYISEVTQSWQSTISEKFNADVQMLVRKLIDKLTEQQSDTQLDRKTLRKKYRDQERYFEDFIQQNQDRIFSIKNLIHQFERDLLAFAQSESKTQGENLRNEMRRVTGSKVVDGNLLTVAFQENQQMVALDAIEALNDKLFEMRKQLEVELGQLEVKDMNNKYDHVHNYHKESAFKFEKGLTPVIGIGGSIGGIYAGLAIGTAIGGPIGTVVGGVVGVGISLFSYFVGSKSKEYVEEQRRGATIADLEGPIQSFQDNLCRSIQEHISQFVSTVKETLDHFIASQERQLERERDENRSSMQLTEEELAERRAQIEKDLAYLEKLEVSV